MLQNCNSIIKDSLSGFIHFIIHLTVRKSIWLSAHVLQCPKPKKCCFSARIIFFETNEIIQENRERSVKVKNYFKQYMFQTQTDLTNTTVSISQ